MKKPNKTIELFELFKIPDTALNSKLKVEIGKLYSEIDHLNDIIVQRDKRIKEQRDQLQHLNKVVSKTYDEIKHERLYVHWKARFKQLIKTCKAYKLSRDEALSSLAKYRNLNLK